MKTNVAPLIFAAGCFSLLVGTTDAVMAGKGKQRLDDQQESTSIKRKVLSSSEESYNLRSRPHAKMASPKRQKASKLKQEKESEKPESSFTARKTNVSEGDPLVSIDNSAWQFDDLLEMWYQGTKPSDIEIPQAAMSDDSATKISKGYVYLFTPNLQAKEEYKSNKSQNSSNFFQFS